MENNETTVFLIPTEAAQFLIFREHYDFFSVLTDNKVHEIKNGKAILNFDSEGALRTVVVERIIYKN